MSNKKKLKQSQTTTNATTNLTNTQQKVFKIQYVNDDQLQWSLQLNKYLTNLIITNEFNKQNFTPQQQPYQVWKKNINGKPHKRLIELVQSQPNSETTTSDIILTDNQKQISLKSIKELTFNTESHNDIMEENLPARNYGFSLLIQGMETPIYYYFESESMYNQFIIEFSYAVLKRRNLLHPHEEFCMFKIVSDNSSRNTTRAANDDLINHSGGGSNGIEKLKAHVGIPFHFSMETFDIFGQPIDSDNTWWRAIIYKKNGNCFVDTGKKVQQCDLISHSQNSSIFACTTNESGEYCLEVSNAVNGGCGGSGLVVKRFDMEFHPSIVSWKNSFVSFENGSSRMEMKAGEGCKIEMCLRDMFCNRTLMGFDPNHLVLHFFDKITKSRWSWKVGNLENAAKTQVSYSMNENNEICFYIESYTTSQLEIEVFYKNEKTIPLGVMNNEISTIIDNRLQLNIVAGPIHAIEILNLNDLKNRILTSLTPIIIKFKAIDLFGNEISLSNNFEQQQNLEFQIKRSISDESRIQPPPPTCKIVECKEEEPVVHCCCAEFIPEWSGLYSIQIFQRALKQQQQQKQQLLASFEISVQQSECETHRMKLLEQSEYNKKLKEKKEKIELEINNSCKFKTFRQVLNHVIEKYHTSVVDQQQQSVPSLLPLHTTAERSEILRVYKKVIFIIHTDQSPLLKKQSAADNNSLSEEQIDLITFELNTVFNAVQNAYQSWKKLA